MIMRADDGQEQAVGEPGRGISVDDLVDRVLRKLSRHITIENERRGWSK